MEIENLQKKTLVFNILNFLEDEVNSSELSAARKESLEAVIHTLESVYEISNENKENLRKIDLLKYVHIPKEEIAKQQLIIRNEYKKLANTAMESGDYLEAVNLLSKSINFNSKDADCYYDRAAAYIELDNNKAAIADCRQAIKLDPTCSQAYDRLGIIYSGLNNWEQAVKAFLESLKHNPRNTSTLSHLRAAVHNLIDTMEFAIPPHHLSEYLEEFIISEWFLSVARETISVFQSMGENLITIILDPDGRHFKEFFPNEPEKPNDNTTECDDNTSECDDTTSEYDDNTTECDDDDNTTECDDDDNTTECDNNTSEGDDSTSQYEDNINECDDNTSEGDDTTSEFYDSISEPDDIIRSERNDTISDYDTISERSYNSCEHYH